MSIAGGVNLAIERARSIDCTVMQIFVKNNMQWFARPLTPTKSGPSSNIGNAANCYRSSRTGTTCQPRRHERAVSRKFDPLAVGKNWFAPISWNSRFWCCTPARTSARVK
jgi:hypothetical protein